MQKAIFIYNPIAGGHKISHELDNIINKFQENSILLQPYRLITNHEEDLISLLKNGKFEFAVVSGGDGTLNSIVNLFMKNNVKLPVGIIPAGTCNDLARSLNLPTSIDDCIDVILSRNAIEIDVGLINDEKYFLTTCAGGSFVDVSFNTHGELKKNFGPFAYYLKGISEVRNLKSFKLKIKTDTEIIDEKVILFLVLNGKDAAGFSNLTREADLSDGMMDIVIIKKCSHIDLASLFFKVLSRDSLSNKNVRMIQTHRCTIEASKAIDLSIDGEKGCGLPVDIKFLNKALKVFVKLEVSSDII